jgi:hypothetical protein
LVQQRRYHAPVPRSCPESNAHRAGRGRSGTGAVIYPTMRPGGVMPVRPRLQRIAPPASPTSPTLLSAWFVDRLGPAGGQQCDPANTGRWRRRAGGSSCRLNSTQRRDADRATLHVAVLTPHGRCLRISVQRSPRDRHLPPRRLLCQGLPRSTAGPMTADIDRQRAGACSSVLDRVRPHARQAVQARSSASGQFRPAPHGGGREPDSAEVHSTPGAAVVPAWGEVRCRSGGWVGARRC